MKLNARKVAFCLKMWHVAIFILTKCYNLLSWPCNLFCILTLRGFNIMSNIDRSKVNQCLAKAIAYKNCGKDADALAWARELVRQLECASILNGMEA
jgi:hypothetical protein